MGTLGHPDTVLDDIEDGCALQDDEEDEDENALEDEDEGDALYKRGIVK